LAPEEASIDEFELTSEPKSSADAEDGVLLEYRCCPRSREEDLGWEAVPPSSTPLLLACFISATEEVDDEATTEGRDAISPWPVSAAFFSLHARC
jgi:hypothetical protein